MLITADFVMWHEPPIWFPRKRVASLLGDGKTLLECLRIDELTAQERIWLATRKGACSERVHRLFACWCAEQVLPRFERAYPGDDRPRMAIQVARRYAMGEATSKELSAAYEDAQTAKSVARSSGGAAWYASCSSCGAAWHLPSGDGAGHPAIMTGGVAPHAAALNAALAVAIDDHGYASRANMEAAYAAQVAAFIELLETHGE